MVNEKAVQELAQLGLLPGAQLQEPQSGPFLRLQPVVNLPAARAEFGLIQIRLLAQLTQQPDLEGQHRARLTRATGDLLQH